MKYVGKESLGEALHVALRKGCDSAPTSAAHNCIGMMPNSLWGEYLGIVGSYFAKAKAAGVLKEQTVWEHLKYVSTGETRKPVDTGRTRESKLTPGKMLPVYDRYEPVAKGRVYDLGELFSLDRENSTKIVRELPKDELCFQSGGATVDDVLRHRDRWRHLFKNILRTFTDDDWKGYGCFLFR